MPFQEFADILKILNTAIKDEFRDQMTLQSFGAWQIIETIKAMFGGEDNRSMNFSEYAKKLGLLDDEPPTKEQIKIEKQKALQTAEEIVQLYKQGANK